MAAAAEMRNGTLLLIAGMGDLDQPSERFRGVCVRLEGCVRPLMAILGRGRPPVQVLAFCQKIGPDRVKREWAGLNYSTLATAQFTAVVALNPNPPNQELCFTQHPIRLMAPSPPPFQPALFYCLKVSRNPTGGFEGRWTFGEIANLKNFNPNVDLPPEADWPANLFNYALQLLDPDRELPRDQNLEGLSPYELYTRLTEWNQRAKTLTIAGLIALVTEKNNMEWPKILQLIDRLRDIQKIINALRLEIDRRGLQTPLNPEAPNS